MKFWVSIPPLTLLLSTSPLFARLGYRKALGDCAYIRKVSLYCTFTLFMYHRILLILFWFFRSTACLVDFAKNFTKVISIHELLLNAFDDFDEGDLIVWLIVFDKKSWLISVLRIHWTILFSKIMCCSTYDFE